jgi:hypothetical protein
MQESVPSFQASWDLLEIEAARRADTDYLIHDTGASHMPAPPDHGAAGEFDAVEQYVRDGKGGPAQESTVRQTPVTVHVFETTTSANLPAVAAGS